MIIYIIPAGIPSRLRMTDHRGTVALVGTLTAKLMEAIDCDFVLVKPGFAQAVCGD